MLVYADNAATTKISGRALEAMMPYYETIYGNPSSLHTYGQRALSCLEPCEIVFFVKRVV